MDSVPDPLNTTGKRIRVCRTELGLTQGALAHELAKLGVAVDQSYISSLETTNKIPSGTVLRGLAKVLQTTTDYLLMLTEDALIPGELDEEAREVSDQEWELVTALRSLPDPDRLTLFEMIREMIGVAQRQRRKTGRALTETLPAVPATQVPRVPRTRDDLTALLSALPEDVLEELLSGAAGIIRRNERSA